MDSDRGQPIRSAPLIVARVVWTADNARTGTALIAVYGLILLLLAGHKPLWLDELLQLTGTTQSTPAAVASFARRMPGGGLLDFLLQWATLRALPFTTGNARAVSLVFGIGAAAGIFRLLLVTASRRPLAGLLLFLLSPLVFRYALEARPYALALCAACWGLSTLARARQASGPANAVLFALCLAAALYSQPYAAFVLTGAAAAILLDLPQGAARRNILAGLVAAWLAWLPFFIWARDAWRAALPVADRTALSPLKYVVLIAHQWPGGGYWGAAALLLLIAAAPRTRVTRPWWIAALCGVLGPLSLDAWFGYFTAPRQLVFALPPLILLIALFQVRPGWRMWVNRAAFALCCTVFLVAIVHWQLRPGEDWSLAAVYLERVETQGACVVLANPDTIAYFRLYAPGLRAARCRGDEPQIVLAADPYTHPDAIAAARRRLPVSDPIEQRELGQIKLWRFVRNAVPAARAQAFVY